MYVSRSTLTLPPPPCQIAIPDNLHETRKLFCNCFFLCCFLMWLLLLSLSLSSMLLLLLLLLSFCEGGLGGEGRRVRPAGIDAPEGGLREASPEGGVVRHRQLGRRVVVGLQVPGERASPSGCLLKGQVFIERRAFGSFIQR